MDETNIRGVGLEVAAAILEKEPVLTKSGRIDKRSVKSVEWLSHLAAGVKVKSPEWRVKISEGMKQRWNDPEYRKRNLGKHAPHNPRKGEDSPSKRSEVRALISERVMERMKDPEIHARMMAGIKTRKSHPNTPEQKRKIGEATRKRQRKRAETLEGRTKMLRNILDHTTRKPNKSELRLDGILQAHFPNEWKYVGDGALIIGGLNPDFVHMKEKKVVELFGRYWHEDVVDDWKRTEFGRLAVFAQLGYECVIIYDDELTDAQVLRKMNIFIERSIPQ